MPGRARFSRAGRQRVAGRARRWRRSSRREARQFLRHRRRRAQGDGLRHRQAIRRAGRDRGRLDRGNAAVHVARADRQLQHGDAPHRLVRAGHLRIRDVHRFAALHARRAGASTDDAREHATGAAGQTQPGHSAGARRGHPPAAGEGPGAPFPERPRTGPGAFGHPRPVLGLTALLAALLVAGPWTQAGPTDRIAISPAADFTIAGAGLVAWVVPELLQEQLAPARCVVCDGDDDRGLPGTGSRGSLNGVDAYFHDAMTGWLIPRKTADTLSNIWSFALVPAGAFTAALLATGPHASPGAGYRAAVIVGESAVVSAALVQGVKFFVARKRPFVRYGHR